LSIPYHPTSQYVKFAAGLDIVYIPLAVGKEDLETVVKALKALDFIGFNVTIPYKRDIMKYLTRIQKKQYSWER